MCCFSPVTRPLSSDRGMTRLLWRLRRLIGGSYGAAQEVVTVAGTRIFARRESPGVQSLAYSMELSVAGEVAMILPLPVAPGSGEGALTFVDLSSRSRFFDELEYLFLLPGEEKPRGGPAPSRAQPQLVVHTVGAYEASFVPTVADFSRLDPRFRLPESTWEALGDYQDYGFAVFKLARARRTRVHPMAFRFQTRAADRLFFPTVHVHDGQVHAQAHFDHALYYQRQDGVLTGGDERSDYMPSDDNGGLLLPAHWVFRRRLVGPLPNRDTWVEGV